MIHFIKTNKFSKVIASYLAIQLIITTIQPSNLFALTSGPSQPEFNSFTPIGTSDMVDLSSGDFNYNIPVMDVGGYPLNLAYNSGITMDQEASWVGLGWNLNIGQIARNVRGIPDDFKGDEITYENDMRDNVTIGTNVGVRSAVFGSNILKGSIGLGVEYNNYNGYTFIPSFGVSFGLNKSNSALGLNISSATGGGASISPSVSLSQKGKENVNNFVNNVSGNFGLGINSRQGVNNLNLSFTNERTKKTHVRIANSGHFITSSSGTGGGGGGGSISFNDLTSFTPQKAVSKNTNSRTFHLSAGPTAFGLQLQGEVSAYGSYQSIDDNEKNKPVPAFGYENTELAEGTNGILDFNREKDNTINRFSTVLPVTNYAYDIYAIQGQGTIGTFRPFRSQVSYVYDNLVSDTGTGVSLGAEVGFGNLWYAGAEIKVTSTNNTTGKWESNNLVLDKFLEKDSDPNPIDYESTYFKQMGELVVDDEYSIYESLLHGDAAMRLEVGGQDFQKVLQPSFMVKTKINPGESNGKGKGNQFITYSDNAIETAIKRTQRESRNHAIQKITNQEAFFDPFVKPHGSAKKHHTVGIKTVKPDGSTYVFGEAAYNTKKVEATFDVSGATSIDCATGLVDYNGIIPNSSSYSNGYVNKIITPAYAHTYLLTAVLSSDYEDVSQDGPTDDDLGAYTKFNYENVINDYKWRIPFQENMASYNEGLKSNVDDQVGNYIYGEKQLKYISSIETKTHVAVFQLLDRHDSRGVSGENGGLELGGTGKMKKLEKIFLFTKPEYKKLIENTSFDNVNYTDKAKAAIKIAHFKYDYSLCKDVANNDGEIYDPEEEEIDGNANKGKLTLKKIYFTYRNSTIGMYTPYKFHYDEFTNIDGVVIPEKNESYNIKGYDIWGNYKENSTQVSCEIASEITNSEYPFVEQNQVKADENTRMWTLTSIDLPSGGKLEFETESDDYRYVQDRETMSMIKVSGAGNDPNTDSYTNNALYAGINKHNKYLYIELPGGTTTNDFINNYIGDQRNKPIYFRFLLNMAKNNPEAYDYVTGYFEIDQAIEPYVINDYGVIPLKTLEKEGGFVSNNKQVNPIAKAGWHFGRTYLNRLIYTGEQRTNVDNFEDAVKGIWNALKSVQEIFVGPNQMLERKGCAKIFNPEKSWIRLKHPNKTKLGGGLRVKRVVLKDRWDEMTDNSGLDLYKQHYGQEYTYKDKDGLSSGVASFEPNGSKENPFVEPFYSEKASNYADRMVSPNDANYVEKPFGETFFPSANVSYGRVTVKNLKREEVGAQVNKVVNKHATGRVVTEFYTCKDFPTISDYTDINGNGLDQDPKILKLLNFRVRNHMTLSQGFSIVTNDMSGKMKSQRVYGEEQTEAISGVDYVYNLDKDNPNRLNNILPTIDSQGTVATKVIGQTYDVTNDFRENKSETVVAGVNANATMFLAGIIPNFTVLPLPNYAKHNNILRTAVTTKVIHKTGILLEKIAYDLGAKVSTKNLAWDADTGQVLLTETVNEYDDKYYNFNYPAYWYYKGMAQASRNLSIEGYLVPDAEGDLFALETLDGTSVTSSLPFQLGDMLYTEDTLNSVEEALWLVEINGSKVKLMDIEGHVINLDCTEYKKNKLRFKIMRSGYKNTPDATMASVTTMVNPIDTNNDGDLETSLGEINASSKVVNASAVRYNDYWKPQDQLGLPRLSDTALTKFDAVYNTNDSTSDVAVTGYGFNPYLYNARGEWRAIDSYAYLTTRSSNTVTADTPSLQNDGYFSEFSTFYGLSANNWGINSNGWTKASTVTQYSPYGAELENRDALNRYSSALYGYAYTLPTAVASNSEYKETAYDGFEDYNFNETFNNSTATLKDENGVGFKRDHFSFKDLKNGTETNGELTSETSHTGKNSYKVTGNHVEVHKAITPYFYDVKQYECYESDQQDAVIPLTLNVVYNPETYDLTPGNPVIKHRTAGFTCTINAGAQYAGRKIIAFTRSYQWNQILLGDNGQTRVVSETKIENTNIAPGEPLYLYYRPDFNGCSNCSGQWYGLQTEFTLDANGSASYEGSIDVTQYDYDSDSTDTNITLFLFFNDEFGRQIGSVNQIELGG